jgi:hypothetical protein
MLIDEALSSRPAQIVNSHLWQPAVERALGHEAEGLANRGPAHSAAGNVVNLVDPIEGELER